MLPKRFDPVLRFFDMCPAYQQHEDQLERWMVGWLAGAAGAGWLAAAGLAGGLLRAGCCGRAAAGAGGWGWGWGAAGGLLWGLL
jgi:hypothetical protein